MNGSMLLAQTWICCVCLIRLHRYFHSGRHQLNEVKVVFHWCMLISALGAAQWNVTCIVNGGQGISTCVAEDPTEASMKDVMYSYGA